MDEELIKKLNYKEGDSTLIINAPEGYLNRWRGLHVDIHSAKEEYDFIQVFLYKQKHIPKHFEEGIRNLKNGGKLWFCYAKKGSDLSSDITRDKGWEAADLHDFVAVRQVSIDNTWSALRFKPVKDVKKMQRQSMRREFQAEIIGSGESEAAYIKIPFDMEKTFGTKSKVKVIATIDGHEYRSSIESMGNNHILMIRKDIREIIGKNAGDTVNVAVQKDVGERTVEIPDVLERALNENPFCKMFFNSLSYSNRKEYATWVGSAKRAETQQKRVALTIEKLKAGLKNPYQK